MTPLRQRYIQDLQLRNRSPGTIAGYVSHVAAFAKHFGRSPEELGLEEIRSYQVYLVQERRTVALSGPRGNRPLHPGVVRRACKWAAWQAKLTKHVTPHTLRHSMPRTCWRRVWTSGPCRSCWDTADW